MNYPALRMRRLRESPVLRHLIEEASLSVKDLVMPLFVKEALSIPASIESMPGQFQHSPKSIVEETQRMADLGIRAVILFGIPSKKDVRAQAAFSASGIIQKTVEKIKRKQKNLLVITDVCLCEYQPHGHCGHVSGRTIDNDSSAQTLAKTALSHARAGADMVAPSDMMDGRVGAIRRMLDRAGFSHLPLMSYAVKYASSFYAPFREAAESAPGFGDRLSYQMNPKNRREAFREAELDLNEGADILLVKPALSYLDIVRDLRDRFDAPVAAYSVSGEYAMIKAAAARGWLDERKTVMETHVAMKRAGASFILTYWAGEMADWFRQGDVV